MESDLFRRGAVERLYAPDGLEVPARAVTPRGWLALAGLGLVLGAAVVWSVIGRVSTDVHGVGVLAALEPGSVVVAEDGGVLVDLPVSVGQVVREGDVVARLRQSDLDAQLRQARADLAELERQHATLSRTGEKSLALEFQALDAVASSLRQTLELAEARRRAADDLVRKQESLLAQALVTESQVLGARQARDQAVKEIGDTRTQVKEQEARRQRLRESAESERLGRQLRIDEARNQADALEGRRDRSSQVRSPRAGRVAALRAAPQSVVAPGTPLLLLSSPDRAEHDLHVLAYVSATQGKRIRPGMPAEVSPTTVKREQYGSLAGRVRSVSDLPADAETLTAQLSNKAAVQQVLERVGVPYVVRVDLEPDPAASSGYRWSSPPGPPVRLDPGTPCAVEVTVERQPPATLVLPFLKKEFGLDSP